MGKLQFHRKVEKKIQSKRIKPFHRINNQTTYLFYETQAIQRTENKLYRRYIEEVQANKSTGRMPWHQEPMKDVISCDKLRLAANKHSTRRFPNEETHTVKNRITYTEYIGIRGEPPELKHLSRGRKRNQTRFRE